MSKNIKNKDIKWERISKEQGYHMEWTLLMNVSCNNFLPIGSASSGAVLPDPTSKTRSVGRKSNE